MKLISRLLPEDLYRVVLLVSGLSLIRARKVVIIAVLTILVVGTEAFGLMMLYPILQFLEAGRDAAVLGESSKLWSVINSAFEFVGIPVVLESLLMIVLVMIVARQLVQFVQTVYLARIRESVARLFRIRVFGAIIESNRTFIDQTGSGAFVQTVQTLCHFGGTAIESLSKLGMVVLALSIYGGALFVVTPITTAGVVLTALLLSRFARHFRRQAETSSKKMVQEAENFTQYLTERYRAWRLLKFGKNKQVEEKKFRVNAKTFGNIQYQIALYAAKLQLFLTPVAGIFVIIILYISVEYLSLTLAEITLFVFIYLRVMPMVNSVLAGRQQLATVSISLSAAKDRLEGAIAAREKDTGTRSFDGINEGIRFDDVFFSYGREGTPVLRGVTLDIPAGSLAALIGPSGAGKSTLVDMLPRLNEPAQGKITLDGVDISEFSLSSLREGMSFVPQTPLLIGDTVRENIRFGSPDATDAQIEEAARLAHADEFIELMDFGYDTIVGEAGDKMSGGQKQRIALARAFVSEARLLILDEPTSALDPESETFVTRAISEYASLRGATVIIIAHRESTIRHADLTITLDAGRVASVKTAKEKTSASI